MRPEGDFVFLSYAHADRASVDAVVEWIKARGLDVWYSGLMRPGDFEVQIGKAISNCAAVIAIVTKAGVGKGASTWVEDELVRAKEAGKTILPCVIGDFWIDPDAKKLIKSMHQIQVDKIEDLIGLKDFQYAIDALIEDAKGPGQTAIEAFTASRVKAARADVKSWYDNAPRYEDQALALAIASLPDVPADLITLAASDLRTRIEKDLRAMTRGEQKAQPRTVGAESLNTQLTRVRAERVRITEHETERPLDVIKFVEPRWDYDLLDHVWTERLDVRDIYLDWLTSTAIKPGTEEVGRYAARTIGALAGDHFASIRMMVLADWMQLADGERFVSLEPVIRDVLRAAVEEKHNVEEVKKVLLELARQAPVKDQLISGQQAALLLVLSEIGLRRPELAIAVMKLLGWRCFRDDNFQFVMRSSAFYGMQTLEAAHLDADDSAVEEVTEDTPELELSPEEDKAETFEGDTTEPVEAEKPEAASASVPAMAFIAALADWADEPIKAASRAEQEEGKLKRQVPMAALLMILGGMPLLSRRKSTRLTLEEMLRISERWDATLLDRIVRGLVRAGMARPYRGPNSPSYARNYQAANHLGNVIQAFAKERWQQARGQGLSPETRAPEAMRYVGDPLIDFTRRVYAELEAADRNATLYRGVANIIVTKLRGYLTQDELDDITKPPAADKQKETAQ